LWLGDDAIVDKHSSQTAAAADDFDAPEVV